ncbi:[Pyruvate dehydrogenase (acetyl-transferring)] kinase 1, mitochondrial, partial [Steccherinum ochraceum]
MEADAVQFAMPASLLQNAGRRARDPLGHRSFSPRVFKFSALALQDPSTFKMFSRFQFFKHERPSIISQRDIEPPKRRKSLPPPASPRLETDTIVKRVSVAYGQVQEEAFLEDMFRAAHDPGFLNIRAPLRESASMDWIRTLVRNEAGLRKSASICLPIGEGNTGESATKAIIRVSSPRKCKNNALVVVVPPQDLEESAACSHDAPTPLPAYCPASYCDEPTQDPACLLSPTLPNDCSETSRTLVDTPQITAEFPSHLAPAEDSVLDIDQLTPLDDLPSTGSLSESESIESCAEYLRPMMAAGANPSTLLQAEAKQACVASRAKVQYSAQYSPAPTPIALPPTLSLSMHNFTPVETLGSGAFGMVYRTDHKQTGIRCALKVMNRPYRQQFASDRAFAVAAGNWMMMAVKEQGAMKRVEGVEGVVQLLGSFYDSNAFYLVMPYYAGGSLRSVLDDRGALPLDMVTRYAAEL